MEKKIAFQAERRRLGVAYQPILVFQSWRVPRRQVLLIVMGSTLTHARPRGQEKVSRILDAGLHETRQLRSVPRRLV
jgi:hypothetical protein